MTFPEWTKPAIYGVVGGAIAISVLGFSWGGWTTAGSAQEMAEDFAEDEVTLAMVPICVNMSAADPERPAKIMLLRDATGYNRTKALMDTGWSTIPGSETPSRDLAEACMEGLALDG